MIGLWVIMITLFSVIIGFFGWVTWLCIGYVKDNGLKHGGVPLAILMVEFFLVTGIILALLKI